MFLQTLESTPGLPPGLARELQRLGVTGPNGLESHLTGDLVIEGSQGVSSPAGAILIGTDDEAVMNRAEDTVVLTGNVKGTHTRPDQPEPGTLQTDVLTYNHKTGEYRMRSADETRSRVTFKPKPKPAAAGDAGAGAATAPKPAGKPSRRRGGK